VTRRLPARANPTSAILPAVDRLVEQRYDSAVALVEELRQRSKTAGTEASTDVIVDQLVRRYSRELGLIAAVSGGAAAMPGAGTATALLATSADVAYTIAKLGEMVLAIGVAHGHDADSIEERKAWVLAVLSMGRGAVTGVEGLAGRVGAEGGARIVSTITATQLDSVNSKLATKVLARLATEQSAARLGRLLPFGIGAGVGAAGNVMIVRSVAKTARQFFADPGQRPDTRLGRSRVDRGDVLDVTATDADGTDR